MIPKPKHIRFDSISSQVPAKNSTILVIFIILILTLLSLIGGSIFLPIITAGCYHVEVESSSTLINSTRQHYALNTSLPSIVVEVGNNYTSTSSPFKEYLAKFDFSYIDTNWTLDDMERFFLGIQEFHIQEPLVPINTTCHPKPLPSYNITCGEGVRAPETKIGLAVQFGFDVDTLEIHLQEVYDVVDKIFIVEMAIQHNQMFPSKQLIWDRVKVQDRFRLFRDKIVHFVLDDLDIAEMKQQKSGMWATESTQEVKRWEMIEEWNAHTGFFGPNDLIGFGDTDEIASRENILKIKQCDFNSDSIDVGIWFPNGPIDQAFRTDYPANRGRGHMYMKYTLGDPTFWTFSSARKYAKDKQLNPKQKPPSRLRGLSKSYLLGGMHMSHYGYLPYHLIKMSTATEGLNSMSKLKDIVSQVAKAFQEDKLREFNEEMSLRWTRKSRTVKLSQLDPNLYNDFVYLPWFYDCNRDRYPRWEGNWDSRLGF